MFDRNVTLTAGVVLSTCQVRTIPSLHKASRCSVPAATATILVSSGLTAAPHSITPPSAVTTRHPRGARATALVIGTGECGAAGSTPSPHANNVPGCGKAGAAEMPPRQNTAAMILNKSLPNLDLRRTL